MSRKKTNKRIPENAKKKFGNFSDCPKCGSEQQVRRVMVVGPGPKKRWACIKCGEMIPSNQKAPSKEY